MPRRRYSGHGARTAGARRHAEGGVGPLQVLVPDDAPLELDALRGELYRLADAFAHASAGERSRLASEFEQAWAAFKSEVMKHR